MESMSSIASYASLACTGIFLFYVLWHSFRGFFRGALKQLLRIAFVLAAAFIAFVATNSLWKGVLNILDGRTVESFFETAGIELPEQILNVLSTFDIQVAEYVLALPIGVVVMPLLFAAIFFVVNIILKPVYLIIATVFLGLLNKLIPATRITGLVLGAVEGVIVASVILLPFAGISEICNDAYVMITETNEERGFEETEAEKAFCEYIQPFAENPVLGFVDSIGSELVLDRLASFEDGDVTLNMRDEFASVIRFAFVDIPAFKDTNWLALTDQDKAVIDDVVDFVSESDYKASIVAELLGTMTSIITKDETSSDSATADVISAIFDIFADIDRDELPDVLNTFKEFYFLASDEGILNGFSTGDKETLTNAFTQKDESGETTILKMIAILNKNERTKILVTTISKMTITVLSESAGLDEDAIAKYNDMKESVSGIVNGIDTTKPKEEQIADVSAPLAETFERNGLNVDAETVDQMAEYIVDNYAEVENISEEEFDMILLNYYQSYQNGQLEVAPQ